MKTRRNPENRSWPRENAKNTKKKSSVSAIFAFLCGYCFWLRLCRAAKCRLQNGAGGEQGGPRPKTKPASPRPVSASFCVFCGHDPSGLRRFFGARFYEPQQLRRHNRSRGTQSPARRPTCCGSQTRAPLRFRPRRHGRISALPPPDREPSRFAAHHQAQKP